MAIGFTPKHTEIYQLTDLSPQQFLALANEAVTQLNWKLNYISNTGLIAYTDNGMFSWNGKIKIVIENKTATIQSISTGSEMMDLGKNKKNVNRFITCLEELKTSLSQNELTEKHEQLSQQLMTDEEDILQLPPPTTTDQIKDFFSIFKPTQGYYITPILLNLNLLIFILMAFTGVNIMLPDNESLLNWGANFRPVTLEGQWWRLLTSCFLHIGVLHLLMNMYALLYIGMLLEPYLGSTRFITAYLLTGISASVASLWWHDLTISAGASGAIFGMYGVFLALLTTNLIEKTTRKALLTSIAIFTGYNLLNGLKGGIDNAAHIGGLVSGVVMGYAFIPSLKNTEGNKMKWGTIGLLSVVVIVSSSIVYTKLPNDLVIYDAKIKNIVSLEAEALEVYKLPENTVTEKILYGLKDKGIHNWEESIKIIDSFKDLDLTAEIRNRNKLLKEYCELRKKSYELLYKAIAEKTEQYKPKIEEYDKLIEVKIKELGGG